MHRSRILGIWLSIEAFRVVFLRVAPAANLETKLSMVGELRFRSIELWDMVFLAIRPNMPFPR